MLGVWQTFSWLSSYSKVLKHSTESESKLDGHQGIVALMKIDRYNKFVESMMEYKGKL